MEYLSRRRASMPQSSPKQSSPIPIRKISSALEPPFPDSYSPRGSKGSLSPISSHRGPKNSSRFNGVPKIMVFDSQGQVWSSGELNIGHDSSPSPPSSSPSFSNLVPHVDSTQSLDDPISEDDNNEGFYSHEDIMVAPRKRRVSLNLKSRELSNSQLSVSISGTRYCASEDEAEEMAVSIYTKKKKRKFLNIYEPHVKSRSRSKSTDASIFMQESPGSSNKMKKFFKRLRSKSQGDITSTKNLKKGSNSNSQDDINSDYEGSFSEIPIGDPGEVPAAAINVSLLSKIKNYISKPPRKITSHDLYSNPRSSRKNSEIMGSDDDFHDCLHYPFESFESIPNSDYGSQDKIYGSNLRPFSQQSSRSNSEYELTLDMKVKKKSLVSRFKNMAKNKKRDRSGSLPNVLDGVEIKKLSPKVTSGYHQKRKRSSLSSSSDRNDGDRVMFMGDLAIENYFGENGETLSLENLSESRGSYERIVVKKEYKLSMENILGNFRGKSRSMDYTFHRPFDLETLKKRLGDRSSSEPTKDIPDASEVRGDGTSSDKKGSSLSLLSGSVISYTVQANDTLMSIAARFDTTPSELTKMNRLSTRFLFPGQILTVPDKGGAKENLGTDSSRASSDIVKEAEIAPFSTDVSSQKSSEVANCPKTPANSLDTDRSLDKECLEKFLKIQVRHITDGQGVVAGVLLVTPNAVMFDPNVSDPLVIERGSESYGVIAPMDFVVNAALYYDIAHMKVKDTGLPRPEIPKPEIYYGPLEIQEPLLEEEEPTGQTERLLGAEGEVGMLGGSEESPSKDGTFPELTAENDNDNDSACSCGGETRETSAFPKAFEHELLTPISSDASPTGGEGASQQPPSFVQGDLAPIEEGRKTEEAKASSGVTLETPSVGSTLSQIGPAQDQCDTTITATPPNSVTSLTPLAQEKPPLTGSSSLPPQHPQQQVPNDKKRTTSVTFSTSSESDMPPLLEDDNVEMPSQESRKQKVLKRISYPLSWMESFGGENKDPQSLHQGLSSSAPPSSNWMGGITGMTQPVSGDLNDSNRQGMFSNVFSITNVSNMLTRRTSTDYTKRNSTSNQGSESPQPSSTSPVPDPLHTATTTTPATTYNNNNSGSTLTANQQTQKRMQYKEGPKFGLKSMVSMDDMPDLFASFDKLIPKPASTCEESPLYLCLRMGTPIGKVIPRSTPIMTYGKKTMRPEYWFSIPKNRTDELYNFFQIWASDVYGELDEMVIRERGFNVLEEEVEICPQPPGNGGVYEGFDAAGELKEMTKESWEVVSMSEELRKALYSSSSLTSLDIEAFLPEIQAKSEIIDESIRKNMYRNLPARVQGYNWNLVFTTSLHGFNLKSLYRKMTGIDSAILLFIQDTNQNIFGAFLSCPLRVSDLFYGTGEAFLFKCQPEFEVYPWTGENTFFARGNNESLVIGGGDGKFGILLDGDLFKGRSEQCRTFNNPILSGTEDFVIKTIECWYFE